MAEFEGLKTLLLKLNFNILEDGAGNEETLVGWSENEEKQKFIETVEQFFNCNYRVYYT